MPLPRTPVRKISVKPSTPATPTVRKGARRMADISPALLKALNEGAAETKTLVEALALDMRVLLGIVADELGCATQLKRIERSYPPLVELKIMARLRTSATLLRAIGECTDVDVLLHLKNHQADTARSWGAFIAGEVPVRSLASRFRMLKPFADDPHMGVRECAWMALRPHIQADLAEAMPHLLTWSIDRSENVRRCAVESTRPRGVWCNHFTLLKERPSLARPLLDNLMADPSRYVQNSVANWLNDASKSDAAWVRSFLKSWTRKNQDKATIYIAKRALRTVGA